MRIYIKQDNGWHFKILAPIWLVKAGLIMGGFGVHVARKHITEENRTYIDNIDFNELRKGIDILKEYKGLNLVDVKAKDGTEVKIVI